MHQSPSSRALGAVQKVLALAIATGLSLLVCGQTSAQPLNQRVLDRLVPGRPSHPVFTDPLTLDSPNAAARYLALFTQLDPELSLAAGWTAGDPTTLSYGDEEDAADAPMPIEELRRRLDAAQPWIEQVIEASRMDRFDRRLSADLFVRPLDDTDPRQPLHREARATSRILRADASRLWEAGRPDQAMERLATIIRFGGQLAENSVDLIDVLVAQAVVGLGVERALQCLAADPRAATDSLVAAVNSLDPHDPTRSLEMWSQVHTAAAQVAEEGLQGEEIGDRLLALLLQTVEAEVLTDQLGALFQQALEGGPVEPDVALAIESVRRALDTTDLWQPAELRKVLAEGRRRGDRLVELWYTADGAECAESLQQRTDKDQTRLLATLLPVPRGIQKSSLRLRDSVNELREVLELPVGER